MRVRDVVRSSAFRATVGFALATTVATMLIFVFVYWRITTSEAGRVRRVLVEEAAKGANYSEMELRKALELRLTRDLRRLDYVALFAASGAMQLGNVDRLPAIPIDGKSHLVPEEKLPGSEDRFEPAVFVARSRSDGGVLLLGRSLSETFALRQTVINALATAIVPTLILAFGVGMLLARRMTKRLDELHGTITKIMAGGWQLRLPEHETSDEIGRLSRDVNQMLDEIVRLIRQLRNVGENIAHDLRTPLAVMRAKLERGLVAADEPSLRQTAGQALEELDKAIAAIAALLRVAEIENGPSTRRFKPVDLAQVCEELFDFYEPLAEAKSVSMTLRADSPVLVPGDGDLLREGVSNLIDNAIKFAPVGGKVQVEATASDGRSRVVITDNGVGVPSDERNRIFERYFRGERNASTAGVGVGLSITAAIARLHEFDLTVSDNGPGARFEIVARNRQHDY